MSQRKQWPYCISRRELLLLLPGMALLPDTILARDRLPGSIGWDSFLAQMKQLADAVARDKIDHVLTARRGMEFLQHLNIDTTEFEIAVNESYETGNQYWMWQRMLKQANINGGILNIDRGRLVPLHDHPGATGMLRIISGETEVWQFDRVASSTGPDGKKVDELTRVLHRTLRPGDTAVLTPDVGNIHALRAVSEQCSMLDFFIPPYKRSQRSWYEPIDNNWFNSENITCRSIPQHEYAKA